ncbi:MAG TPA: hypothetical protein VFM12_02620, partial [Gemmatimonadales bacterium]|nr:hypothetical protein [Gemmatimonadales bacterium]
SFPAAALGLNALAFGTVPTGTQLLGAALLAGTLRAFRRLPASAASAGIEGDTIDKLLARIARIDDELNGLPDDSARRSALGAQRSALKAELAAALARRQGHT